MAEEHLQARMHGLINELLHDRLVPELLEQSYNIARKELTPSSQMAVYEFHESDIISFSNLLIENNLDGAEAAIEHYLNHGCSMTHLTLDLFSDSARHLGEMWCTDECSFADVTVGLATLHQLLRKLDGKLAREIKKQKGKGSILLTTIPKDTHIFGVAVLDLFFTSNGWYSQALIDPTQEQILETITNQHVDVVGLSVSCSHDLDECKALIKLIRECSRNTNIKVMVGGNIFIDKPELANSVNADVSAKNALEALHAATNIYDQQNHNLLGTSPV